MHFINPLHNLHITPAQSSDCKAIIELAGPAWQKAYSSIISQNQIKDMLDYFYSSAALYNLIDQKVLFIARQNDELVGFCTLIANQPNAMQLERIYVAVSKQGTGVGKALIEFAKQQTLASGLNRLYLYVNRKNTAIQFYKKSGFEIEKEVDRLFGVYPLNDYIMSRAVC